MSQSQDATCEGFELVFTELVHCVDDPNEDVRSAVQASLTQISTSDPAKALRYLHALLKETANEPSFLQLQLTVPNRIRIFLCLIDTIISQHQSFIQNFKACKSLIKTVSRFLDQQKWQASPAIQDHASSILVNLSSVFRREVVEHLLTVVSTEKHALRGVIETAGRIASQHSHNIMQLLPVLLSQTMNYMVEPSIDDVIRTSLTVTLGQYCDAALEYLASVDDSSDTWNLVLELISTPCASAVDTMLLIWLSGTKDPKLLHAIFDNIGSIASLTDLNYLVAHLPKLINILTGQLKKSTPLLEPAVVRSLNSLFETVARRCAVLKSDNSQSTGDSASVPSIPWGTTVSDSQITKFFEGELDNMLNCLLNQLVQLSQRQLVSETPDVISVTQKTMNEIKRALASLCTTYPVRVLNFTEAHLHSGSDVSRSISLNLLRHLVSSCDRLAFNDVMRKSILANLVRLLFQSTVSPNPIRCGPMKHNLMGAMVKASPVSRDRASMVIGGVTSGDRLAACIRYELVKIVLTLGSLNYFNLDPGAHVFVEYVVRQCAAPLTRTNDNKATRAHPSQEAIRSLCVHVLKLSSTTVPSMLSILWPFLLEFIMVPDCTEAVGVICDSIANIFSKSSVDFDPWHCLLNATQLTDGSPPKTDSKCVNVPAPCSLLARLTVLLGWPLQSKVRGLPILRVMQCMARFFHQSLPTLWDVVIPHMLLYLNQDQDFSDDTPGPDQDGSGVPKPQQYNQNHWEDLTLKILSKSIDLVEDDKWTLALLRSLENQIPFYEGLVEEKGFLFQCITMILCKLDMNHVVAESIELVFRSTNHDVPVEQECCVVALGRIASTHNHVLFNFLSDEQVKLDSYSNASVNNNVSANRFSKTSFSPAPVVNPTDSPGRRLSNLFRSSGPVKASSSALSGTDRPLPHNFRGSVEQAKATVIWTYANAIENMGLNTFVSCADNVLKTVIHPIVRQTDQPLCIQLTTTELCCSIARTLRQHLSKTSDTIPADLSPTMYSELLQNLVKLLINELRVPNTNAPQSMGPTTTFRSKGDSTPPVCIQLRYAVLVVALDVVLLETDKRVPQIAQLLQTTAAAVLPIQVNSSVAILDYSGAILSSMDSEEPAFAFPDRLSLVRISQNADQVQWHTQCLTRLHHLWTMLLRLQCSEELISEMFKVLTPYLHDSSFVVNVRALCLLISILATILCELQLVNKELTFSLRRNDCAPLALGQLMGHLVISLGKFSNHTLRHPAKLALWLLLRIQNLFVLADAESTEPTSALNGNTVALDGARFPVKTISTDRLICDLAKSFPKTQVNTLLEFVTANMVGASNSVDELQESLENSEDEDQAEDQNVSLNGFGRDHLERSGSEHNPSAVTSFHLKRMRKPSHTNHHPGVLNVVGRTTIHQSFTDIKKVFTQLQLPRTSQGYLLRLLYALLYHWCGDMDEEQVGVLLRAIHRVYSQITQSEVRTGLLYCTAELGRRWTLLCLRVISANPLPLDHVWTTLLAGIAFLPTSDHSSLASSTIASTFSQNAPFPHDQHNGPFQLISSTSPTGAAIFPHLLAHVLKLLECCHPYERREVPADAWSAADKRWLLSIYDKPMLKEANFATHFWLSLVNCLQVLSFPRCIDELIGTDDSSSPERSAVPVSKLTTKLRKPILRRAASSPESCITRTRQSTHSSSPLVHLFGDPQLFSRLLGQWFLACATAAVCRTLTGKSYETRSGAEANLQHGVKPVTIAMHGLRQFLRACNFSHLEHCLTFFRNTSDEPSEPTRSTNATSSKLWNPGEDFLQTVDAIVRFVVQDLQLDYTSSLVQFFSNHVNSTYDVRRLVSCKVMTTVLAHLNEVSHTVGLEPTLTAVNPDILLNHILRRMDDSNTAVRQVVVHAFSEIGSEQGSITAADSDLRIILIRRNANKIIQGLLSVIDGLSKESDNPTLFTALHSLCTVISFATERHLGPLLVDLCLCLLPIYSASAAPVRAAAFRLFGILMQFAWESASDSNVLARPSSKFDALSSEASTVFIPMTLHLADPDEQVVQVCKTSLKQIGLVLFGTVSTLSAKSPDPDLVSCSKPESGSRRLLEFLQTCLRPNVRLHLGEFYNDLARLLVGFFSGPSYRLCNEMHGLFEFGLPRGSMQRPIVYQFIDRTLPVGDPYKLSDSPSMQRFNPAFTIK